MQAGCTWLPVLLQGPVRKAPENQKAVHVTARGQRLARRRSARGLAGYNEVQWRPIQPTPAGFSRTFLVPAIMAPQAMGGSVTHMQCCAALKVTSRCTCQLLSLESLRRHVDSALKVLHADGSSKQQQHLAFEGDGWRSPPYQRSIAAGCNKSPMLDSSYMLAPAGAEPQPQQPATVPAASPKLLAHSQWPVQPALRKTSRRAAAQPRPGSAASRSTAGAAGLSGDADADGSSGGQVGIIEGVTCAWAWHPCKTP